ncbi:GNAT family N-acetyltransferase [Pseudoalteromonas sp. G4]|uniref:GNAT family N-acetyltransferase n=1 Tax=Pseudoalteromonas sp. G4 TaxID=2992761 RepID=UPI00237DF1FC|nr:GNAT family N-acetyltransferase [Pseudoalteromonas sp. G4]MDE3270462.1 GNAT family N-acetyltransferase [Pseudoalteromonas sp. G4]
MYSIKVGELTDIAVIETQIPEFTSPKKLADIQARIKSPQYLLLVTYFNQEPVGYKLGYALSDKVFYSWLGAVLPSHRGHGLAQKKLDAQERWIIEHNYSYVQVKTMNRFRAMLGMLIKNNYHIIDIEKASSSLDVKIRFEKCLINA